ncbi:MAG: helix-turn-helix domain-containing protein [Fibrobacter sp.]|nr:helix-turn-helix domain-containing protein [Fibrobacter sp.]
MRFIILDAICKVLDCQPGDVLEYRDNVVNPMIMVIRSRGMKFVDYNETAFYNDSTISEKVSVKGSAHPAGHYACRM